MAEFSLLDISVIAAYLGGIVLIGFWVGRGERDAEDYFLAGRGLPWYLIGFSLFASNMSGASFVGLMGASYEHGMVVFNYEWTATLVLIFFALFMLPVFLRARLFTVPEYLEARFDRRSRWAYAGFTICTLLLIDTSGALYAGGIVISTMFPAIGLWQTTAGLAVLAGGYTLFGGLRAVVVTDAVQAVLMIVGAALIVVIGLDAVGGWDALTAQLSRAETELMKPADDAFLPWPGILGVVVLGFYYWSLNQYFVQRALAARTLEHGRAGALFGGLLKLPNVFLMVIPGMIAMVLLPDLEIADRVFPSLITELLPVGLRGLVLAALIAAIMSSLDSALNAAASLLTMDFVRPLWPDVSSRRLLAIGRLFTALLIVVAACYAPLIERFGTLFLYFQATLAYIVPPIVAVYLGGLFSRRFTAGAAFWAMTGGVAVGIALFLAKEVTDLWTVLGLPDLHFTYMALLILAGTFATMAIGSLIRPTAAARDHVVFEAGDLAPSPGAPSGWYRDHRVHAVALTAAMLAMLAWFW